jgi:hypothetical protein
VQSKHLQLHVLVLVLIHIPVPVIYQLLELAHANMLIMQLQVVTRQAIHIVADLIKLLYIYS